jgi:polyhydroxyalkanoate synthesis regulator phasin
VEALKTALRELARREPEFLIDLIADAASSRRDLTLKLASVVAGIVAVPLDVATKQDMRRLERRTARLEREVKEIKNATATKEDLGQYATKQVLGTAVE